MISKMSKQPYEGRVFIQFSDDLNVQSFFYNNFNSYYFHVGLRVVELDANLLSGRLTGMLFSDQGAEVIILSSGKESGLATKITDGDDIAEQRANDMLNRNKVCTLISFG